MRLAIALLLIAAFGCAKDESRIRHASYGMHSTANEPGHDETIEVTIPESFVPASFAVVIAIDDKGRRHKPKEIGVTRGATTTFRVRVALPDDAQIRVIHAGDTIIDLRNSRFSKVSK